MMAPSTTSEPNSGILAVNSSLKRFVPGRNWLALAAAIMVVSTGCEKASKKVENAAPEVVRPIEPSLPMFKLPDMARNISFVRCEHDDCRFFVSPANDAESRLMSDLDDKIRAAMAADSESTPYKKAADDIRQKLNEFKSIGGYNINDKFTLACPAGPVLSHLDAFDFYADDLDSGAMAVIKASADIGACTLAIRNARLPDEFRMAPLQNLAGQPSATAILENVRTQLLGITKGMARKTLARLDMGNPKLVKYARGRFPGSIDGVVSLAWVPVKNDPKGRKIDALLFIDQTGKILLAPKELSVGDDGQESHEFAGVFDLDGDHIDELMVKTWYSGGGYTSILYWVDGAPKSVTIEDHGG